MRPQVGQVINNKYRLLRLIGDGGMGAVYEARHEVLGTSVALKFLHLELSRRQGLVQRFLQEARVSAQIQSPNVVRVTDVDQTASGAFIVMEYLEGRTLQRLYEELYRAGQQLPYDSALEYAVQMLEGVEAAHRQAIVHRDLKPDNVMITQGPKGRPLLKLLDFGIAKLRAEGDMERGLTRPGVIMGTPEYMAPEQAFSADTVDARADIFSLGVMIFEMLAGRRPVGGDEPREIAAAYLSGNIAQLTTLAPNVPPDLAVAVHKAMAATPKDRWPNVGDLRDALEPFAIAARAPSALPPGASLSNPGISRPSATPEPAALTPPATNVGEALAAAGVAVGAGAAAAAGAPSPVPKTLPPVAGEAPVGGSLIEGHPDTNPADPPTTSQPRGPTPLGGFLPGEAGPLVPPTKSAAPYLPGLDATVAAPSSGSAIAEGAAVDPAATAFAAPLAVAPFPATEQFVPPIPEMSPRPSGTSFGAPSAAAVGLPATAPVVVGLDSLSSLRPDPQGYPPNPSDAAGASHPGVAAVPSGAAIGPAAFAPKPSLVAGPPPPAMVRGKPGGLLRSLPAILLLAAAVASAVVGGVYFTQIRNKPDDRDDPPTTPPTATVQAEPPAEVPTTPPTNLPVNKPPFPPPTLPPHKGPFPPPKGSGTPNVPPSPSTSPTTRPVFPFPIVIPSSLPFDLPFPPAQPPRNQPSDPPRTRPRQQRDNPDDPLSVDPNRQRIQRRQTPRQDPSNPLDTGQ